MHPVLHPSHPITHPHPDPTPHHPTPPSTLSLDFLFSLGVQTQTAQNVVDRIQKFKRLEVAAAPPGQLKLKKGSPFETML